MTDQPYVTLNDGRRMPQFGLGVWQTPDGEAAQVARTAIAAGYRAIDTAAIYENERGVGEGLASAAVPRGDVFLTSKLWNADQGYDEALRAFDRSFALLGGAPLDLYLVHWPSPWRGRYLESWKALVRLHAEGRALSIGVSNFYPEHLERVIGETGVTPVVNQVECHPRFQQRALRAVHDRLGIRTESWSPLGQGQLLQDPAIGAIAARHGRSPAQVIIRWHLQHDLVVIPKSANPDRIRENIAVFDFVLDAADMATLDALDSPAGRIGPDPMTFHL